MIFTNLTPVRIPAQRGKSAPVVDVVIPVYNEEVDLEPCVQRLHAHLADHLPYPFRITIADNASTDATPAVAKRLAERYDAVHALRLTEKGRGRALRTAWSASDASVLVYMDVDLSTDLAGLLPLIAPLISGHSDLAIGTRLHRGSRVVRGTKRELISRSYNLLLRRTLAARFSDAQCGFKAIRSDVAAALLPHVEDNTWFFDTELLILAERAGLRIHEVPVDWIDDPNSSVHIVNTARDDLRGIFRLAVGLTRGKLPMQEIAAALGRRTEAAPTDTDTPPGLIPQLIRFAAVGILSTLAYAALFLVLHGPLGSQGANALTLLTTTMANTSLNRRFTFGITGRARAARQQFQGLAVFGLTLALTSLALFVAHAGGINSRPVELAWLIAATGTSTLLRFLLLRRWVFPKK